MLLVTTFDKYVTRGERRQDINVCAFNFQSFFIFKRLCLSYLLCVRIPLGPFLPLTLPTDKGGEQPGDFIAVAETAKTEFSPPSCRSF